MMRETAEGFRLKDEGTIVHLFHKWVVTRPRRTALLEKRDQQWKPISWRQFGDRVAEIAFGLKALGIGKGDRVAIFSENRVEWTFCDMAILAVGAVTVPIYATSAAEQVRYILAHSGSRVVFVNTAEGAAKVAQVRQELPDLEKVVTISAGAAQGESDLTLADLCRLGRESKRGEFADLFAGLTVDDLSSIMYTSGTTGPPKGCMLTHGNIIYICQSVSQILPLKKNDLVLSFLPLAHAMERNGGQFISIYFGLPTAYATSLETVPEDLRAVRPTFSRAVPRFFEKAYNRVQLTVAGYSPRRRAVFAWALEAGKQYQKYKQAGRSIPPGLVLKRALANLLVYRKIKKMMGGRLRFFVSGGAPLSREIIEFFTALGILVAEGYGLTETTVLASINRMDDYRFGTVGRPIPGAEIKIAPDGEILIRHPGVMLGYYRDEQATREVLDEEGWFYSGDIGFFDEVGYLVISDRKKDLIITAGGKNVTPQNLENALKTHPLISQVAVYGDRRPYLVALITLDEEALLDQAPRYGITLNPNEPYSKNKDIIRVLSNFIEEQNSYFSRAERIKKFAVLDSDFSQELGEITPTQKVKRAAIYQRYRDLLEALYRDEGPQTPH